MRLSREQREVIEDALRVEVDAAKRPAFLPFEAMPIFATWDAFGQPCTIFSGWTSAVVDERSRLMQPRLEYLRAFVPRDDWEVWRRLWDALDRELIDWRRGEMKEAAEKAKAK